MSMEASAISSSSERPLNHAGLAAARSHPLQPPPGAGREPRHGTPQTIDLLCAIAELSLPHPVHPIGKWELLTVFRRLTALVVIWVSLLAAAPSAFACAWVVLKSDCCPAGSPTSRGGEGSAVLTDVGAALCCAAQPEVSPTIAAGSVRTAHERNLHPPLAVIAESVSWTAPSSARVVPPPLIRSPRNDGALTYLHTARLRL
jgi:hypothetical protein